MKYEFPNAISSAGDVSRRIDTIRLEKKFNQEQFAAVLNISQPAVSKYLRDRIPPAEILLRLAQLGNTTIEWILTGHKNYFFQNKDDKVSDKETEYNADNDLQLAKKISSLEAEPRQLIISLINYLAK